MQVHHVCCANMILGPSPTRKGEPVCLHSKVELLSTRWSIHTLEGGQVGEALFTKGETPCWSTAEVASGIYMAVIHWVTPRRRC